MASETGKGDSECPNRRARRWVSPTLRLFGLLSILSTTVSTSPSMAQARQDDLKSFAEAGFVVEQASPSSEAQFTAYRPDLPEFRFVAFRCGSEGFGCEYDVYFGEPGQQGKLIYRFNTSEKLEITGGTDERASEDSGCSMVTITKWASVEYSESGIRAASTYESFRDSPCGEEHGDLIGGLVRQWTLGLRSYEFYATEIAFDPIELLPGLSAHDLEKTK